MAKVRKEELPDNVDRRIFVFERASQFDLLSQNPEVAGSNPVPATNIRTTDRDVGSPFFFCLYGFMGNSSVDRRVAWRVGGSCTKVSIDGFVVGDVDVEVGGSIT